MVSTRSRRSNVAEAAHNEAVNSSSPASSPCESQSMAAQKMKQFEDFLANKNASLLQKTWGPLWHQFRGVEVRLGAYMLDPWERVIFMLVLNTCLYFILTSVVRVAKSALSHL